jgi:hypothetical protein
MKNNNWHSVVQNPTCKILSLPLAIPNYFPTRGAIIHKFQPPRISFRGRAEIRIFNSSDLTSDEMAPSRGDGSDKNGVF